MSGMGAIPVNSMNTLDATAGAGCVLNEAKRDLENRVLTLHGCYFDIVTEVMLPWMTTEQASSQEQVMESAKGAESMLHFVGVGAGAGLGEDFLWRTLAAGKDVMSDNSIEVTRRLQHNRENDREPLTNREISLLAVGCGIDAEQFVPDGWTVQSWIQRRWLLMYYSQDRTLFKTSEGKRGLCYHVVQPGDVVTLLWGIKTLIVLRKRHEGGFISESMRTWTISFMENFFIQTLRRWFSTSTDGDNAIFRHWLRHKVRNRASFALLKSNCWQSHICY